MDCFPGQEVGEKKFSKHVCKNTPKENRGKLDLINTLPGTQNSAPFGVDRQLQANYVETLLASLMRGGLRYSDDLDLNFSLVSSHCFDYCLIFQYQTLLCLNTPNKWSLLKQASLPLSFTQKVRYLF